MKKIICFFMLILISSTNIAFATNYKIGSKGQDVKNIQHKLSSSGYSVGSSGVDGIFGKGTADAVKRFQKDHGLQPDGIVGVRTYQALFKVPGKNQSGPVPFTINKKVLEKSALNLKQKQVAPEQKHRTLRQGDSGQDVKEVQVALINKGYSIGSYGADSKFGKSTKEAIKQFQKDNNLNVDGIVGPATLQALKSSSSKKASSSGTNNSNLSSKNSANHKKLSELLKSKSKPSTNIALMANPNEWINLGKGWEMQVHKPTYAPNNPNVKPHFHVNKDGHDDGCRRGSENLDGTPSHGEAGLGDDIPNWVKEKARNHPKVKKEREKLTKAVLDNIGNNLDDIKRQIKNAIKAGQTTITIGGTIVAITAITLAFPLLALI